MLLNCGVGEYLKIQPAHPKGNKSWIFIGRTHAEAEALILGPPDAKNWLIRKYPDVRKDWGQEKNEVTGWDSWMASLTRWTWVWVNSGSWWWTGRPGMLRFMGSQTVGHDWAIELNWTGMLLGSQDLTFSTRDLNLCHRLWRLSTMMSSVLPSKGQVYHIAGEGTSWAS